jgi:hypothetical protein
VAVQLLDAWQLHAAAWSSGEPERQQRDAIPAEVRELLLLAVVVG